MRTVTLIIMATMAAAACSDSSSRLASPSPRPTDPHLYSVSFDGSGNPVPSGEDRILVDTRTSMQQATSLSAAWALFPGNDHSSSSAGGGTGWAFSTNFDGNGTHALRADWQGNQSCSYPSVRVIDYFPTPKPKQVFIQWHQYLGRSAADAGGLGSPGAFQVTNSACPTRGRQELRVLRSGVGGGSTDEIDHVWTGSSSSAAVASITTGSGSFGGNQGWVYYPEQTAGRPVTITVYMQAESAAGANDGVITVWIDGRQFMSRTNIATNAYTFDRFELPSMFAGPPIDESEYFWGVVAWQPSSTTSTGGVVVSVSPSSATIDTGQTVQLSATVTDTSKSAVGTTSVSWTSLAPSIAAVDANGLVTGVSQGTANIVASDGASADTSLITVNLPVPSPLPVSSVSVKLAASQVTAGQGTTATATLRDAAGDTLSGRGITWTSSNPGVATVSASGTNSATVSSVAAGTANIIATSEGVSGQATLTVVNPPPATAASVTVSPASASMNVGGSSALTVTVRDSSGNVISRPVTWASSNTSVATLSNTSNTGATVNGAGAGSATVTATADGVHGSSAITVNSPTAASVVVSPSSVTMNVGSSNPLTVTVRDASGNVISRPVTWASSNTSVASLSNTSNSGATVSGKAQGSATITATADGVNGSSAITVNGAPPPPPPGIPAPGPGATIIQDLRAALQSATTIDQAFRIFGPVDHTPYRGVRNTSGWSFTANADGNGLHALRADWEASSSTDQGIRVIDYLPSPKPTEMYIQWKARVGRYAFDTDGNGNADSYATYPQSNTCKRALVSQTSGLRIDYTLNRTSPEIPKVEIDPRNFVIYGDGNVWNFNSEVGAAPYTSTIHIKQGSGGNDGVYQLWIDDKLVLDVHNAPIDASTFDRWEFPATCTVVPQPQADYFWDFLIWKP